MNAIIVYAIKLTQLTDNLYKILTVVILYLELLLIASILEGT